MMTFSGSSFVPPHEPFARSNCSLASVNLSLTSLLLTGYRPYPLLFFLFRVLKHLAGGYLAERGYHGLVVGFDKMPRALEDVPRPLGSEMHEGEPARNFLQTIFDRNPCHKLMPSLFKKSLYQNRVKIQRVFSSCA